MVTRRSESSTKGSYTCLTNFNDAAPHAITQVRRLGAVVKDMAEMGFAFGAGDFGPSLLPGWRPRRFGYFLSQWEPRNSAIQCLSRTLCQS